MSSPAPAPWRKDITRYLLFTIAIATLGPLQFGYHLAELNAPEKALRCVAFPSVTTIGSCIPLTTAQFSIVSSIFTLGGLVGALAAGPIATRYGRVFPQRTSAALFLIGGLSATFAASMPWLIIGRIVAGLGAGAATVVVPIYISEIAPKESKGMFGALTQITINVGILEAQILGYLLNEGVLKGWHANEGVPWRAVLGLAAATALFQCFGSTLLCESPEWLGTRGRVIEAKKALRRIRGREGAKEDMAAWLSAADEDEEASLLAQSHSRSNSNQSKPNIGILAVLTHPLHRKAIVAVIAVMLAQQFCGINAVIMYSVSFLSELLPTTAGLITVAVGCLNLVTTVACAPLSDKLGRKTCLLLSITGMGVNALLLGFGMVYGIKILSGIATLLFVASFAVGLGPVPFILASELVDAEAVGATQSWALAANWSATFVVAQFFPIVNKAMGKGRVFFVFAALALGFGLFLGWFVPETKGMRDADEVWGRSARSPGRERRED